MFCLPVEPALNVGVHPLVLVAGRAEIYHLQEEMTKFKEYLELVHTSKIFLTNDTHFTNVFSTEF